MVKLLLQAAKIENMKLDTLKRSETELLIL